ncbi:MAG: hypothetical protein JO122_17585 [Acetobacteraceae bacterium]|nr:hypothetical protein [Acetobacteraceae bacterium]
MAQLPASLRAPAWLTPDAPYPATELLACSNGLLHLPTRTLIPHSPNFFSSFSVNYAYDPDAPDPTQWLNFLNTIWPNDQESIETLQDMFGLFLATDTSYQKIFLLLGPRRSGKGTIERVLTALIGNQNIAAPTLNSLPETFGIEPLIGKPVAIISDARLNPKADVSAITERLLTISGEGNLSVPRKYKTAWTGYLPTRFLILTNLLPNLGDASGALASRFIILQLSISFYGREDRPHPKASARAARHLEMGACWVRPPEEARSFPSARIG